MTEALLVALISSGCTLLGTIITVNAANKKTETTLQTGMAVMENEVKNLRKEVEKHNNFAERIPQLEEFKRETLDRIDKLENFHME